MRLDNQRDTSRAVACRVLPKVALNDFEPCFVDLNQCVADVAVESMKSRCRTRTLAPAVQVELVRNMISASQMVRSESSVRVAKLARSVFIQIARMTMLGWLVGCIWAAGETAAFAASDEGQYKESGGLAVYLGILPAEMVKGHTAGHQESTMHGGVPVGRHEYHVLVAVFDAASGERVIDAEVMATISGLGHVGGSLLQLAPMTIENIVTYGNFVDLPGNDAYEIKIIVKRLGKPNPVSVQFSYDHRSP